MQDSGKYSIHGIIKTWASSLTPNFEKEAKATGNSVIASP